MSAGDVLAVAVLGLLVLLMAVLVGLGVLLWLDELDVVLTRRRVRRRERRQEQTRVRGW